MKKIFTLLSAVAFSAAFGQMAQLQEVKSNKEMIATAPANGVAGEHQLIQYTDPNTRSSLVACSNANGVTNHFSRLFDFAEYGITSDFTPVSVGVYGNPQGANNTVELAFAAIEGDYNAESVLAGLNEDAYGSMGFDAPGWQDVPLFDEVSFPANKKLAVAVSVLLASNGSSYTDGLFLGNNEAAQTGPSYIGWPGTECVDDNPTNISDLGFEQSMLFHVNGTTADMGLVELGSNKLGVYPNPASTELNVSLADSKIAKVEIADVTGRVIPAKVDLNGKVNVSNLSQGVYFLRVKDDKGVTRIQKFIKK